MRLPYTDNPPTNLSSEDAQILERVKARRGERGLIPLDLALLHAPKMADGWNALLGAVRTRSSLEPHIRELAILRPALINKAWFEWRAHASIIQEIPDFNKSKMTTIQKLDPTEQGELDEKEWAVLRYADAMTKNVEVPDEIWKGLRDVGFSEQEIIEITVTVASYNMVSRFLVALDVGEMNDKTPEWYGKD